MVGLYLDPPERALVFCVDEKSQIQALGRSQPVLPMMPGVPQRVTHDYVRAGTTTWFAAPEVATGKVIGSLHRLMLALGAIRAGRGRSGRVSLRTRCLRGRPTPCGQRGGSGRGRGERCRPSLASVPGGRCHGIASPHAGRAGRPAGMTTPPFVPGPELSRRFRLLEST